MVTMVTCLVLEGYYGYLLSADAMMVTYLVLMITYLALMVTMGICIALMVTMVACLALMITMVSY